MPQTVEQHCVPTVHMNPPGWQTGPRPQTPPRHGGVQHSRSFAQVAPSGKHDGAGAAAHAASMHVRAGQHAVLEAQATPAGEHAVAASAGA